MPDVDEGSAVTHNEIHGVLPAGTTLRGYELKSILGKGAFGVTYRACEVTLNRDVAIKEYLPTSLAFRKGSTTVVPISPDHAEQFAWGRERFLDEARTLERLDHAPAVVRVLDFLEANGTAYMVMALVEGETLNKRLMREQRLAPEVIERLLFPLLDGLEQVHALGFLHRDIKPANIMVDPHDRPTLIDFGASRAAMAGRSTTLTAIFTPGYAAAEQFVSSKQGPWTDIYGLAATLYHAITGRIPPSAIERIMQDAYQPLSDLRPSGYAPGVLAAIDAAMAVRADDRPQTIAEWRQMLLRFEGQQATQIARKLGLVARAARRTRRGGITIKGRALGAAVAGALVLLAGSGYLVWMASAPTTVSTAVLSLSTEQLEQALAERRKADDLAAEKRRLEAEARQKAAVDAEAKRQADAELEQARQARQKAEQELAQLKTDTETRRQSGTGQRDEGAARANEEDAQRKAEAQAASLRQAEEEAAKKAAADAEAKRQADEALAKAEAERQRAEADARAKAEAETAARRQASEEDQRKAEAEAASKRQADEAKAQAEREKAAAETKAKADAEAAERTLRLEGADRERLQVALTSLGFDTRGSDGVFGPRSREMIAAWQKKAVAPATGFLTAAQRDELLQIAAPAVARWEEERKKAEEQKKLEDEKKKSDALQATPASPPLPSQAAAAPATSSPPGAFDGTYAGTTTNVSAGRVTFTLTVTNGRGSLGIGRAGCDQALIAITISPAGEISGQGNLTCPFGMGASVWGLVPATITGRARDGKVALTLSTSRVDLSATLDRSGGGASPAPVQTQPNVASTAPSGVLADGTYSGGMELRTQGGASTIAHLALQLTNGSGRGTVTLLNCGVTPITLKAGPSGNVTGEFKYYYPISCDPRAARITGQADGGRLTLDVEGVGRTTLTLGSAAPAPPPAGPSAPPDGLWRGTYSCPRWAGHSSMAEEFTASLDMQLTSGSGSWKSSGPTSSNGYTTEIRVSLDPTEPTVTRVHSGQSYMGGSQAGLLARYDGNAIRATGPEKGTGRHCSFVLTRA